jgi:3-hydroxyisobutyrate dehydrogenase
MSSDSAAGGKVFRIAFVGLGNMGGGMAANQAKAGHEVLAFDLSKAALEKAVGAGCAAAGSAAAAVKDADAVITMLPAGQHVRAVYADEILANAKAGALLIDCSTIDVDSARAVAAAAQVNELRMVDAPVSGGVAGAEAATLTFMVGGSDIAFEKAKPILAAMGQTIVHAGSAGAGQAAKICNNMMLGVSMIAVCEAFSLAAKLGLDAQKLFDIASQSSGQCWAMTKYCPVPGPVPTSPANRGYQPGFTAAMMLKDLLLAQAAAKASGAKAPMAAGAAALYDLFVDQGNAAMDFSGIIKLLDNE